MASRDRPLGDAITRRHLCAFEGTKPPDTSLIASARHPSPPLRRVLLQPASVRAGAGFSCVAGQNFTLNSAFAPWSCAPLPNWPE